MQNEIKIKFCHSGNGGGGGNTKSSSNLLCEKCNNYQELKLQDLKNFTSKSEVFIIISVFIWIESKILKNLIDAAGYLLISHKNSNN